MLFKKALKDASDLLKQSERKFFPGNKYYGRNHSIQWKGHLPNCIDSLLYRAVHLGHLSQFKWCYLQLEVLNTLLNKKRKLNNTFTFRYSFIKWNYDFYSVWWQLFDVWRFEMCICYLKDRWIHMNKRIILNFFLFSF